MYKIAVLNCIGPDGGGANTIVEEMNKVKQINFDIYMYNKNVYGNGKDSIMSRRIENINYFESYEELYNKIKDKYDFVIVIVPPSSKDKNLQNYINMLKKIKCYKIYASISRSSRLIKKEIISEEHIKLFNYILTFCSKKSKIFEYLNSLVKTFSIDYNFYEYNIKKPIKYKERKNVISFVGRFINIKCFNKIIDEYDKLSKKYIYTIEGGGYSYKDDKVSGLLGVIACLCNNIKEKKPKEQLKVYNDYSKYDKINNNKLNIFPVFKRKEMLERIKYNKFMLFPTNYNNRSKGLWKYAIEYTWLECINIGIPIITTVNYAKEVRINNKKLIDYGEESGLIFINDFSEIEEKCKKYEENYDKNVKQMQEFWTKNYTNEIKANKFIKMLNYIRSE